MLSTEVVVRSFLQPGDVSMLVCLLLWSQFTYVKYRYSYTNIIYLKKVFFNHILLMIVIYQYFVSLKCLVYRSHVAGNFLKIGEFVAFQNYFIKNSREKGYIKMTRNCTIFKSKFSALFKILSFFKLSL